MPPRLLLALAAAALLSLAQPPPAFEFATVKPTDPANPATSATGFAPGRFTATGALRDFVRLAYAVQDDQIVGIALPNNRYDVDARPPERATPTQMKAMLQALLADRFKLEVHRESRRLPVYALVPARKGPKLRAAEASKGASAGPAMIRGTLTLQDLARYLAPITGRTVLDRTGLTGEFEIKLEWMPEEESVFTAIQEQQGLRLESTKAPVGVLVIDHAERPSEN